MTIVIIGAGLHGLSLAYHLSKKEIKDVIMIEMHRIGYGSSSRNAGRFRYHFYHPRNIEFAIEGINYLIEHSKELSMNPLIYKGGYLWILNDKYYNIFKYLHSLWSAYGVGGKFILCRELCSFLKTDKLCYFAPQDGSFHHDYLLYSYYNEIKNKYKIVYDKVEKLIVDHNKVREVKLSSTSIKEPQIVVVTAGAWSGNIMNSININVPIVPEKRELYLTESLKYFIEPLIIDFNTEIYFSQTLKGEIIGGLQNESERGFLPFDISFENLILYLKKLKSIVNGIDGVGIIRGWSGYYEMTPDSSHIMGRGEDWPDNLYIDAGYSGHGAMFSAYAGKIMAEYLVDGLKNKFLEYFSPDRFKYNKLIQEKLVI
jgi:sarcosine oxidase subunit beta